MQRVVTSIRELPGLPRFLLPFLFSDLQCAASVEPVIIINASKYSRDALIVFLNRDPDHIPLRLAQEGARDLSTELHTLTVRATKVDVTRELAFLRKLWDQIVSLAPILDSIQMTELSHSRIWWCPTAEFSVLPLHAAGPYRKERDLPVLYISSYIPTLTALIGARRRDPLSSATERKRFIPSIKPKLLARANSFP